MKSKITLLVAVAIVAACAQNGQNQNDKDSDGNLAEGKMIMAEESELARLMKDIHADAKDWRASLLQGETVEGDTNIYAALTGSEPTNKNVQGPAFEGFSMYYQEKLNNFLKAEDLQLAKSEYNNLVSACVQCHQSYCTGPIPTIEKLYLPGA